jgi:hypothetical protein
MIINAGIMTVHVQPVRPAAEALRASGVELK